MIAEYLDKHPLIFDLAEGPYHFFPTAEERDAWEALPEDSKEAVRALALSFQGKPYPLRRATGFLDFVRTGSRRADENDYFFRRRKLCASVVSRCLNPKESLDDVIDGVWTICEETSWVISAHNVNPIPGAPAARDYPLPDPDKPYIDLFAAQTAMILALTKELLGTALNEETPMICRRIDREINSRVLQPFMNTDDFWWMGFKRKDLNNWTPWILSNVMLCACLSGMARQSLAAFLDRGLRMLDRWIQVMPRDGGCDEGAGYWNMAGGSMLDCLELVEKVTEGRVTFWQEEKIRNILCFPLRAEIGGGWFVNFADCDARPLLSGERLQWAGEKLNIPELTALGGRFRGSAGDALSDVPHFSRLLNLLFHPVEKAGEIPREGDKDVWLPDLQLRIAQSGPLILCCKGGNNGENHNHNDVGSFMLYVKGRPEIVDAGNMVYTAKTFSDQRYTLWNVRGAYHNVPMIGKEEQRPGLSFAGKNVEKLEKGLRLEMGGAYGAEAGILRFTREMRLEGNKMFLRDQIALSQKQPVSWVFMLRNQPKTGRGCVTAGGLLLRFPENLRSCAEEIPVTDPRMAHNFPGSLWRLTVTDDAGESHGAEFTMEANEQG